MKKKSKYKVIAAKRKKQQESNIGTQNNQAVIGKGKILFILLFGTIIVSGTYIYAIKAHFEPIFHIYWILSAVLLCCFIVAKAYVENGYEKQLSKNRISEKDRQEHYKKVRRLKYMLLVLMPFLFTIFGDAVYLFLLKDLKLFEALSSFFK